LAAEKVLQFPRSVSQQKNDGPQLRAGLPSEGNPAARRKAKSEEAKTRKAGKQELTYYLPVFLPFLIHFFFLLCIAIRMRFSGNDMIAARVTAAAKGGDVSRLFQLRKSFIADERVERAYRALDQ